MQEVLKKIIEQLEKLDLGGISMKEDGKYWLIRKEDAIKIVKQAATEYNESKILEWMDERNREVSILIDELKRIKNYGWITCSERMPEDSSYILLSFANFSIPVVGRYEEDDNGGAFYAGDDMETCISQDLIVNAWQSLPEPYRPKGE